MATRILRAALLGLALTAAGCATGPSPTYLYLKSIGAERYYIPSRPSLGITSCHSVNYGTFISTTCY